MKNIAKNTLFFCGIAFLIILGSVRILVAQIQQTSPNTNALTLRECYDLALKQSEAIAIQNEIIKEAEGRFLQSLSGISPQVHYSYDYIREEASSSADSLSRFVFSQPLFSGFKEFAAMSASRAERRQRQWEVKRAEQLLFIDVADAFYFFLQYQQDYEALMSIRETLSERLKELEKRQGLGRSRPSEVASAQARLSTIEASQQEILSQWEVARQLLEFLTGQKIETLQDQDLLEPELGAMENHLTKIENRPDILAAKEAREVTKKQVTIAKAGFWPQVALDGNYYTQQTSSGDWDVTLSVDVPLFTGGENFGKAKEARAINKQEEYRYQEIRRKSELEIKKYYTQLSAAFKRRLAYQRALEATQKNYDLQSEDYSKSLVSNLEVLQALEDLEEIRRGYITVNNETSRIYWAFKTAIGETP